MRVFVALFSGFFLTTGVLAQPAPAPAPAPRSAAVLRQAVQMSEQMLADPAWLKSPAWQRLRERTAAWEDGEVDAPALARRFNAEVQASALPFSHFQLLATGNDAAAELAPPTVHEEGSGIVRLHVPMFSARPEPMMAALQRVAQLRPAHLIVDLRGTPGGALPSALVLARFLSSQPLEAGVFLARPWFAQGRALPTAEQIQQLPGRAIASLPAFQQELQRAGVLRLQLPAAAGPSFEGTLYVLVDGRTASAAEPVAYLLQQQRQAVVLGERTAGAMLSSMTLPLAGGLALSLPVADYVAPDGRRLEGQGVTPDHPVASAQALSQALAWIRARSRH